MLVWEEDRTTEKVHAASTAHRAVSALTFVCRRHPPSLCPRSSLEAPPHRPPRLPPPQRRCSRVASRPPTSGSSTAGPTSSSSFRSSTSGPRRSTSPPARTIGCRRRWTCRATSRHGRIRTASPKTSAASSSATRLLRHRRFARRQRHVPAPIVTSRRPSAGIPLAPGVRRGDPHPRLPIHRRIAGLDESEIFNAYNEVQSIRDKDEFLIPFIRRSRIPTSAPERPRTTRSC